MSLTTTASRRILNSLFGGATPNTPSMGIFATPVTHIGAALDTAVPTQAGANFIEPPGSDGYARVALSLPTDFTNATDADPSVTENVSAINFPEAINNDWGQVTHIGFFTASSGGILLAIGELTLPRVVNVGDVLSLDAGAVQFTLE